MTANQQNSDKKSDVESETDEPKISEEVSPKPVPRDPTRYGDWEKNGRCIDF